MPRRPDRFGLGLILLVALAAALDARAQCAGAAHPVVGLSAPAGWGLADLGPGSALYSDTASFTLVSLHPEMECAQWLRARNADRGLTSASVATLTLDRASVIYVAYDLRALAIPNWLLPFEMWEQVGAAPHGYQVFRAAFAAGAVALGGNFAAGAQNLPGGIPPDQYAVAIKPDRDLDLVPDDTDNCPDVPNGNGGDDQSNNDQDLFGDSCDSCPFITNPDQLDLDADGAGFACDPDDDGDGRSNELDNCPFVSNPGFADADADGIGDACESGAYPLERTGLDLAQPHAFALDLDDAPSRAEIRIEVFPPHDRDVEVKGLCSGADADLPALLTTQGGILTYGPGSTFKVNPDDEIIAVPASAAGKWVMPLFFWWADAAFQAGAEYELNCYLVLFRPAGSSATGTFNARVSTRSKAPVNRVTSVCATASQCTLPADARAAPGAEYDQFTPDPASFRWRDTGNPAVGTCAFSGPPDQDGNVPVSHSAGAGAANAWNCCMYTYDVVDGGVVQESATCAYNVWVGPTEPPGPQPDADGDAILDRCDNCAGATFFERNRRQQNSDALPAGDACQCTDVDAKANPLTGARTDLIDLVLIRRRSAGASLPASLTGLPRCRLGPATGVPGCSAAQVGALRQMLVAGQAPADTCP